MNKVLIVGAGPTGLAAALELNRSGYPVEVIDTLAQPQLHSRALGINARTLELLEPYGVTQKLLELGTRMPELHLNVAGKAPVIARFRRLHHRYNFLLTLAQSDTEAMLAQAALGVGIPISRETELLQLTRQADGIIAQVRAPDGNREIGAAYVLGADGAHSTVRRLLALEMQGHTLPDPWTLADIEADWPFPWETVQVFIRSGHVVLAFPFVQDGVKLVRVVASKGVVLEQLPPEVKIHNVVWQSQFRIHERMATSFGAGRVFLAGDAGHLHSPVGARGMNMGIEDGITFARKLTRGELPNYAAERRRYAQHVVRLTSFQTRILTTSSPQVAKVRDFVLPALLNVPAIEQLALREFSGLRSRS